MTPYFRNGVLGALLGATTGAGVGYITDSNMAAAAALGALGGGALGALRGKYVSKAEDLANQLRIKEQPARDMFMTQKPLPSPESIYVDVFHATPFLNPLRKEMHDANKALRDITKSMIPIPAFALGGATIYDMVNQ